MCDDREMVVLQTACGATQVVEVGKACTSLVIPIMPPLKAEYRESIPVEFLSDGTMVAARPKFLERKFTQERHMDRMLVQQFGRLRVLREVVE